MHDLRGIASLHHDCYPSRIPPCSMTIHDEAPERHTVSERHSSIKTECNGMGRPRLYATRVERKAAWRRRHGMAVRPPSPSAAAKQAVSRARKRQATQALAARECAVIHQALQTRADQCWEMDALIDDSGRDSDTPRQAQVRRKPRLSADAIALFHGAAAARGRQHRLALQRLAHVRATREAQAGSCHRLPPASPKRPRMTSVCVSLYHGTCSSSRVRPPPE
jgi:hypothetical protein